jgi:peptide/nickel transport system ATP-binding protein
MNSQQPLLSVQNLVVEANSADGPVRLLDRVSFDVEINEVLGIVGESGSGKSMTMLAVMGLLPQGVRITGGTIRLQGRDITNLEFDRMRSIRGNAMSMIFQDPMTSLNPVRRVGKQIAEAIQVHNPRMSKKDIRDRVIELLSVVGIPDAPRRARQYPNEFSGGMRQRAMISMAIANNPALLIADEPTTALDVTVQAQVIDVLASVREHSDAAMILITHDLGLVAETAERLVVMYGGRIAEQGTISQVFDQTRHPYTAGLLASLPRLSSRRESLFSIPGNVPDMRNRPSGCVFHPRCVMRAGRELCRTAVPELEPQNASHRAACHFQNETAEWASREEDPPKAVSKPETSKEYASDTLVIENLRKEFFVRRMKGWGSDKLVAVRDVSIRIGQGETVGLVGESGCGKTTLGRVILGLQEASAGSVIVKGKNLAKLSSRQYRTMRREMQVVFQDPYASLDPRMTIAEIVAEPLRINGIYEAARIGELLRQVGLGPEAAGRKPDEFSGGQRQRIAIARALGLRPDLLILDEAVSALDVSIQAQIINLLTDLQKELGLSYLFISHDLSIVRHISDRVAVMYLGRIVESGTRDAIFDSPAHPYTQALLSAIPSPTSAREGSKRIILKGEIPNPLDPPSGCPFRTRCFKAQDICARLDPELLPRTEPGHYSACHFAGDGSGGTGLDTKLVGTADKSTRWM